MHARAHLSVCLRSSSMAGSCSCNVGMVMNSIATVSVSGMRVKPCDSRTPTADLWYRAERHCHLLGFLWSAISRQC